MSMPEPPSETQEHAALNPKELSITEAMSHIEGWTLIATYKVNGRVVDIETVVINAESPTLDPSAGWRVIHEGGGITIVQRMVR